MSRPKHEVAEIIKRFGTQFIQQNHPNSYQMRVLGALSLCRTAALGGHKHRCSHCNKELISYNSCRNRHCPKCQSTQQNFWVEDRINNAYKCKHYHMVFTVPEVLNSICLIDSRWFYNQLFTTVWETLRQFGYTKFGVESGAVCVLHTWGQNLSFHPHVHCIVPALGYTLKGKMKQLGKSGKYLYPVKQLSLVFRAKLMAAISKRTDKADLNFKSITEQAWAKSWVVFCEASMGKPEHVIAYLGQYIHRVAISNHRIVKVTEREVTFTLKDYHDHGQTKTLTLDGVEFLRRFCMHILPRGMVKIRHYGIYSSRFRSTLLQDKMVIKIKEETIERIKRIMGFDVNQCRFCKKGWLIPVEIIPRIRSPGFVQQSLRITTTK